MLTKTKLPFQRSLSFAHLQIPDQSQKEAQALRTISQHYFSSRFRERVRERMIAAREAQPQEEAFLGTPLDAINPPRLGQVDPEVDCHFAPFDDGEELYFGAPTNILALIQREDPYNAQGPIEGRLAWINRACDNPVYQRFNRGALILYAAFSNAAEELRAAVPQRTIHQFLDLILDSSIAPLQSDNSWRKETFSCYLKLIFAGRNAPYQVTEQERRYLVQFATLAEFPLPELVVVPDGTTPNVGITRLGAALQDTPIGLEGTEESTLQLSFQTSLLPSDERTRIYLDALRARQGVALPKHLLGAVMDAYPMDHDEGQQAIDRALSYAFRGDRQGEIAHVTQLLTRVPPSALNVEAMAIPPRIFLLDRLLGLDPGDLRAQETVRQFNQALIQSNQAPQMLMGFAREIKRLTTLFVQDPSEERFAQLLKVKIGYQQLKAQFFDGKVALDGFLKLAVDEAEFVMTASMHLVLETAARYDCNAMVATLHQTEDPDPALKTYAEKAVEKVFRRQQQQGILVTFSHPFFFHFGRNDLDIVSGCVYFDGEQYLELPSELQNHPHIRSLHIHDLPYVLNGDGSFSHYTTEGHQRVAQVRIALGEFGVTIQRRLNISLEGPEEIVHLQYVPLEQFGVFPSALLQRMGAKEFWMDPDGTIYGYTEKGTPIFSFDPQLETIQTASGTFFLSNDDFLDDENLRTALDYLANILPMDEVLVREDQRLIYIPSLELTLTLKEDQAWHWVSPKISGMTLDLSRPPCASTLVLKWEGGAARSSRQFEDQLVMLRKHLREAESQAGSSLVAKEQIGAMRRQIIATEERLAQLDKRLYVTLLPEARESAALRETLNDEVRRLEGASQRIGQARNPMESRGFQRQYLDAERRYHQAKQAYEACCTKRATVTYETSHLGHVKGRDLVGALFLLQEQLASGQEVDSPAWIEELASHQSSQLFDEQTLSLLQHCVDRYSEQQPLISLYCQLLLSQHGFMLFKEAGKSLSPNQEERLQRMEHTYNERRGQCLHLHTELVNRGMQIPAPITTLMHQHCPGHAAVNAPEAEDRISFPLISAQETQALAAQSLLERLCLADAIECRPKNSLEEIPEEQRRLIKTFRNGSNDQATGFYVEAFGMFPVKAFYQEFSLQGDQALFGLKRRDLDFLFNAFESKGWIKHRQSRDFYYSLSSDSGHHPLVSIQTEDLLALLSSLPISPSDREKVVQRIRTFFFQAAHASFSFSWKDAGSATRFQRALAKERARLQMQMLDGKFFLNQYLADTGMSLTELKRKVLTVQKLERPEGRIALIRYLVYQSEIYHLDNISKAPAQGERNQIELLSTRRQYPIDLLLRSAENAQERELQTIHLAFLLFEEDYGARCNPMQVKLFSSLMLDQANEESIDAMQARMGFGKTALLPLLAIVQIAKEGLEPPEAKSLIRYVVPKAVLQDNAAAFHGRISHILGSSVIQDREFSRYQIDPADKERSFRWVLEDLQTRLAFYQNAQRQGVVLIQSPEIRQSMEAQEKAFGFLALEGHLEDQELLLCLQAKQLLGQIRSLKTYTIFDELDATQDFKACEVNFTEGKRLPILPETICPLERLIASIARHHNMGRREALAPLILGDLGIDDPGGVFAQYVTSSDKKVSDIPGLEDALLALSRESYSSIYLIRATLLDPNIFDFMHSKQPNTHFGVRFTLKEGKRVYSHDPDSGSALLIAVPYEGTNTPKGLSTYDCSEVAATTTLRYYSSNETLFEDVHIDFLMKQMQKQSIPEVLEDVVAGIFDPQGQPFIERLRHLAGLIDAAEIEQAKGAFYRDFLENPRPEVRSFFGRVVVATQVRTDEARANSNRYEMGSPQDQVRGCSGTVSSTSSYFEKPAIDPRADGMLSIAIMGRENNAPVSLLPPTPEPCNDYLDHILTSILDGAKPCTRAIIDAAGLCKSRDGLPETIVERLWTLLLRDPNIEGIEGIVYYGKDNVKRLYRGPAHPPIPCTTAMELAARPGKKYFSFYGQKNTRGSDIKQANGAHALVTMDQNVPNADAKQAVLRFRDLVQESSGQTFTFVVTAHYGAVLQQRKRGGEPIDAKDIVKDLRRRELDQEQHDALILFREELEAHAEQAAAYMEHQIFANVDLQTPEHRRIYLDFLGRRDQISSMVEKSIYALEQKYGGSLRDIPRDEFITEECAKYQGKITALTRLAEDAIQTLVMDEVDLGTEFFMERIASSQALFESRYPQDTPVKISAVDSGAEAVAMALAQAEAEALAEAVAETISEAIVHVQDRLSHPRLAMTHTPHFATPTTWYVNPVGVPVAGFEELKHLIRPDLRDQVHLSPHLQHQKIVSHFVLVPNNPGQPHLFLSQEEADRWLTDFAAPPNGHVLMDLRRPFQGQPTLLLLNMKEAVLRQTVEIQKVTTTEELRALGLTNIFPEQLLPSLSIEGATQAELAPLIDLGSFGISRDSRIPTSLIVDRQADALVIQGGDTTITIPTNNDWLSPLFEQVPGPAGKFQFIKETFLQQSQALRARLVELRRKEEVLVGKQQELALLVQDASQFQITPTLRQGLYDRDNEFTNYGSRFSNEPNKIKTCGQAFLNKMEEITRAQEKCGQEGTSQALIELGDLFSTFISEKMREADNLTTDAVFDASYWNTHKEHNLPLFDLVYGRILHSVHGGYFSHAKGCGRDDCSQIFNHTLPAMKATLGKMRHAIEAIPGIEREIQQIQEAIAELAEQMQSLGEADECIRSMERGVTPLLQHFSDQGIVFVSRFQDPKLFWDRLNFNDLADAPEQRLEPTLTGRFPVYEKTFDNMLEYRRRIHSLCPEENQTLGEHQRLRQTVQTLALAVEPRPREVEWA
jgi:hypothetical protein